MRGPKVLLDSEDNWVTDIGAWFPGERVVFRGKDLLSEFHDQRWMSLLLYGITGRRLSENQVRLFEGLWILGASFPDPRLWNNRVAALAGSARSTCSLAVAGATAVSEASIYGQIPQLRAADFLCRANAALAQGAELGDLIQAELDAHRVLPGYGRPVTGRDERLEPVLKLADDLGLAGGEHVKLAFEIDTWLHEHRRRVGMNVASLVAALCADQGLSPVQTNRVAVLCFSAGIFPCFEDALQHPEGAFFPFRCEKVAYSGPARRTW